MAVGGCRGWTIRYSRFSFQSASQTACRLGVEPLTFGFVVQGRHCQALQGVAQVLIEPQFTLGRQGTLLQAFAPRNRRANRRAGRLVINGPTATDERSSVPSQTTFCPGQSSRLQGCSHACPAPRRNRSGVSVRAHHFWWIEVQVFVAATVADEE